MAQVQKRIEFSQLEGMFSNIRAKTKWNVDGPLLWGYFFFDPSAEKLKTLASELEAAGYTVVDLRKVTQRNSFLLHVERVETHSPTTLHTRNAEFYKLAEKYSVASYDGMDVGPAQNPK